MQNLEVADIDFSLAVQLLVQAHEREVKRLVQDHERESCPLQELAPSCISNTVEEPYALTQPISTSAPLSLDCPPIEKHMGKTSSHRGVSFEGDDFEHAQTKLSHVYPGHAEAVDLAQADALELECVEPESPTRTSQAVIDGWSLMVGKLLGSYRDPLKPHAVWQQQGRLSSSDCPLAFRTPSRSTSTAEQSTTTSIGRAASSRNPSGRSTVTNRSQALIILTQKKVLERIESRIMRAHRITSRSLLGGIVRMKTMNFFDCISCTSARAFVKTFMLHPVSSARLLWVFLCLFMVTYELFLVTMTPFGLAEKHWAKNADFFCASFWTIDIGINFRSGILINGNKIEMRAAVVAKKYIRSWFCFDCAIAAMQWYTVYGHISGQRSEANSLASLSVIRVLRLGRVSKILKRFNLQEALLANFGRFAHILIDHLKIGSEVAKGLLAAVIVVHCTACAWFDMSRGPNGWGADNNHLLTGSVLHDYLVCMHWSLAQFQGNVDVYPGTSTAARAFACASTCLSIVFLTFFVSTLTGTLVSLRDERKRRLRDVMTMTRFLDRQSMPGNVMLRAARYVNTWEIQEGERIRYEEDRKALELFPKGLRRQLMAVVIVPYLERIPVFVFLKEYHANVLATICIDSITQHVSAADEDLFTSCEPAKNTYIILSGEVTYNSTPSFQAFGLLVEMTHMESGERSGQAITKHTTSTSEQAFSAANSLGSTASHDLSSGRDRISSVALDKARMQLQDRNTAIERFHQGAIISEASMWVQCIHEGDLYCPTICHCLVVCTRTLGDTISMYDVPRQLCSDYAYRFARAAEELKLSAEKRIFIDLLRATDVLLFEAIE